jgi:sensor histidine kinase YesM
MNYIHNGGLKTLLLTNRWPWHLMFWIGYVLFRFWLYYLTVKYHHSIYLEYMLISEIMLVAATYYTFSLYRSLFKKERFLLYFLIGATSWILYLYGRTEFQFYYLRNAPGFQNNSFTDIFLNNITVVIVFFLFITSCKYFKDGYIRQQFEAAKKEQQLVAEVNNLKSQIAPHFLFNTLNNLYGLAVEKSDKLPGLMLQLSQLLRHSLYETQRPLISISEEMKVLQSYIQLERVRLEDDLTLELDNTVPENSTYQVAPLILLAFIENAFKHAKYVHSEPVSIYIKTDLDNGLFTLIVRNNYNKEKESSEAGIGLMNVGRRLEVLYPGDQHRLTITKDETFYTVSLEVKLTHHV